MNINIQRSGVGPKSRKIDEARKDGFNMAMLCAAAVLNDVFDFEDEKITFFMEQCKVILESIATGQDSPRYIIRELEKMTGVELSFSRDG